MIRLDDPSYVRSIPVTFEVRLHWKDGRITEHRCFAMEVSAEGDIKLWGWQIVAGHAIPMDYEDRPYGLYHRRYLKGLERVDDKDT